MMRGDARVGVLLSNRWSNCPPCLSGLLVGGARRSALGRNAARFRAFPEDDEAEGSGELA